MKILPCRQGCTGQPATATKDGSQLQTLGQMASPIIRYKCYRCGRVSHITSPEYHQLPDAPDPQ